MGAVYGYNTFFDRENVEHKIEIYDTTYGGSSVEFSTFEPGFEFNISGFDGELLFNPLFRTNCVVPVRVNATVDTQMNYLITDLANAKEGQFFCKLYRKIAGNWVLQWIGILIPDQTQVEDLKVKKLSLSFSDGLARLKEFEFDYAITGDIFTKVSDLDILIQALSYADLAQFFGTNDIYISSNINWWEIDQRTSRGALMDTRAMKYAYIDDVENLVGKKCDEVVSIVLKKYGANIRFESGKWIVTQPTEAARVSNPTYFNYTKAGAFDSSGNQTDSFTVSGVNTNLAILTDMWKPMLKNVDVNIEAHTGIKLFKYTYDTNPITLTGSGSSNTTKWAIDYDFTAYLQGETVGDKDYLITLQGDATNYLLYERTPPQSGYDGNWLDKTSVWSGDYSLGITKAFRKTVSGSRYVNRFSGTLYINAIEDTFTLTFDFISLFNNGVDDCKWAGFINAYQVFDNNSDIKNVGYQTTVATEMDASYEIREELITGDVDVAFSYNQLDIYNGTTWQPSSEWEVGTAAVSGYPISQLLSQQALYLQRKPRMLVQGTFCLTAYQTRYYLDWRSSKWILLSGTYLASTCKWRCTWMELLSSSTSTSTGSVNPYRGNIGIIQQQLDYLRDQFLSIQELVIKHEQGLGNLDITVDQLKLQQSYGVDGFLLNNIEGLDGAVSGTKLTIKAQSIPGGFKLIAE